VVNSLLQDTPNPYAMRNHKLSRYIPLSIKSPLIEAEETLRKLGILFRSVTAQINPVPIFVIGNQKSGTSAIAVLLAELTRLSLSMDLEREYLSRSQSYIRMKRGELSFETFLARNRLSFSRDIVKEANLTIFFNELAEHFPASRFVYVLRDPRDNIRSILDRLNLRGDLWQLGQDHYRKLTRGWDTVLDGTWLGLRGENYIEMLARRWNFMVDVYLKNRERIFLVRYEEFVRDKVGVIELLAQRLGLVEANGISDKVDVQFQPKGNAGVSWRHFFGVENLLRIEEICGERMKTVEYALSANQEDSVCKASPESPSRIARPEWGERI